jgi:hypothetical protein
VAMDNIIKGVVIIEGLLLADIEGEGAIGV